MEKFWEFWRIFWDFEVILGIFQENLSKFFCKIVGKIVRIFHLNGVKNVNRLASSFANHPFFDNYSFETPNFPFTPIAVMDSRDCLCNLISIIFASKKEVVCRYMDCPPHFASLRRVSHIFRSRCQHFCPKFSDQVIGIFGKFIALW